MEYQAYPVEHSEKRSAQARKEVSNVPSKISSRNTNPKSREGLQTRSFGPLPSGKALWYWVSLEMT